MRVSLGKTTACNKNSNVGFSLYSTTRWKGRLLFLTPLCHLRAQLPMEQADRLPVCFPGFSRSIGSVGTCDVPVLTRKVGPDVRMSETSRDPYQY
jgi:hypothetical protein